MAEQHEKESTGGPERQVAGTGREEAGLVWSRKRLLLMVFFAGTAVLLYTCYLIVSPFLPAFAWALALAVVGSPIHRWIEKRVRHKTLAAVLAVVLLAVALVGPTFFVVQTLVGQASASVSTIQSGGWDEWVRSVLEDKPQLNWIWQRLEKTINIRETAGQMAGVVGKAVAGVVTGSITGGINLLIAFFILFYFFRDQGGVIAFARSLLPLSEQETDQVFARVSDTVFASIYGTLVVAAVQGTLGGLIFWWLGLPAPLLWGVVMGLLSILPVLGAFAIWLPAAVFLAAEGSWGKALILATWGTVVIGFIDNLLYPVLVGKRMRLHTVPVFIAIVGGLMLFGASGLVIGPVVLALTDAAIDIWRRRTTQGRSALMPKT